MILATAAAFALDSWGDIAAMVTVFLALVALASWLIRSWIKTEVRKPDIVEEIKVSVTNELKPLLVNGDTSVAKYAHEARNAANDARDAAYDARDAALRAEGAVLDVKKLISKEN